MYGLGLERRGLGLEACGLGLGLVLETCGLSLGKKGLVYITDYLCWKSHAVWDPPCYLPPSINDFVVFTPSKFGTRFSDPGGMQG